jgi:hypothetical protein
VHPLPLDNGAVYNVQFTASQVSTLDFFHPSLSGQAALARDHLGRILVAQRLTKHRLRRPAGLSCPVPAALNGRPQYGQTRTVVAVRLPLRGSVTGTGQACATVRHRVRPAGRSGVRPGR